MIFSVSELTIGDEDKLAWWGSGRHQEYIREWLIRSAQGDLVFLALSNDDVVIGACYIDFALVENVGTLAALHIREEYRSQGLGTQLVEAAEEVVRQRGLNAIELRVETKNDRARKLYEKLGYKERGTSVESWEQYDADGEIEMYTTDALIMRKALS